MSRCRLRVSPCTVTSRLCARAHMKAAVRQPMPAALSRTHSAGGVWPPAGHRPRGHHGGVRALHHPPGLWHAAARGVARRRGRKVSVPSWASCASHFTLRRACQRLAERVVRPGPGPGPPLRPAPRPQVQGPGGVQQGGRARPVPAHPALPALRLVHLLHRQAHRGPHRPAAGKAGAGHQQARRALLQVRAAGCTGARPASWGRLAVRHLAPVGRRWSPKSPLDSAPVLVWTR